MANEKEKPSIVELIEGKDVALGREIVSLLAAEEVGITFYYVPSVTTKVKVNQKIGEESYAVTRETSPAERLPIGIVLPTGTENEYVYFGIKEQGFVFTPKSEPLQTRLDPLSQGRIKSIAVDSFLDYLGVSFIRGHDYHVTLQEDEDPEKFNDIFSKAVTRAREAKKASRNKRAEGREKLMRGLFGIQ